MAVNYIEHLKQTREHLLWSDHCYYDLGLKSNKAIERQAAALTSMAANQQPAATFTSSTFLLIPETVTPLQDKQALLSEARKHDHTYNKNSKKARLAPEEQPSAAHSSLDDLRSQILVFDEASFRQLHALTSNSAPTTRKDVRALSQSALDLCIPSSLASSAPEDQSETVHGFMEGDAGLALAPLSKSCEAVNTVGACSIVDQEILSSHVEQSASMSSLVQGLENCQVVIESCDTEICVDDSRQGIGNQANVFLQENGNQTNNILLQELEVSTDGSEVISGDLAEIEIPGPTLVDISNCNIADNFEWSATGTNPIAVMVTPEPNEGYRNVLSTIQDHTYEEDRVSHQRISVQRDHCYGGGKGQTKLVKHRTKAASESMTFDHNYEMS